MSTAKKLNEVTETSEILDLESLLKPVTSSNVKSVGLVDNMILVKYNGTDIYGYEFSEETMQSVNPDLAKISATELLECIMSSESVGKFINANIKKLPVLKGDTNIKARIQMLKTSTAAD